MDIENELTFFFYDLETSGLSPKNDRIMQFAGIRTDLNFNQIGEPVNILVKFPDDTLPSPGAINVTGITPQMTLMDGLSEPEFCKYVTSEIFTPGTIEVGYNSVRFDDEYMRYTFYRNFYDSYEWQWKDGRSRWDLLDVVRMTRALRPEGIKWPVTEVERDGEKFYKPNNRLENLTRENGIVHSHAHDALSDVEALISVAKMISEKQPKLYNFLFKIRGKKEVSRLVNLENKQMFVHSSGRYSSVFMNTTVVFPFTSSKNGNVLVFDLRYNLEELLEEEKEADEFYWNPIVKELALNKCPAVAPIQVLDSASTADSGDLANPKQKGTTGWEKIGLSLETVSRNLKTLLEHPEFAERMRSEFEKRAEEFETDSDVDGQLYEGFVPNSDKIKMKDIRERDASGLADYEPMFEDPRLSELLLHYKGRNFPNSLSEEEEKKWTRYRMARLQEQEKKFVAELEKLQDSMEPGVLEDLVLWYQSLGQ